MTSPRPSLFDRMRRHLRTQWRSHLGTLALVLAVFVGLQAWQTRHVPSAPAPDTVLTVLGPDGQRETITLAAWRARHPGQPVALHFWAEWCPICRTEEHSVSRLARDWPVLTVAMQSGPEAQVRRVLAQRELAWHTALDPDGQLTRAFGFRAVPGFVVVDTQGRLRAPTVGYTTELGMRLRLWWAWWLG